MGKTFISESGELHNVYMKELTVKLWTNQKFVHSFTVSHLCPPFHSSRIHGPVQSNCARDEIPSQSVFDPQYIL